ncbi:MAG: hypothetical protein R6W97_06755, partial [Thiobacillus sp.]
LDQFGKLLGIQVQAKQNFLRALNFNCALHDAQPPSTLKFPRPEKMRVQPNNSLVYFTASI